MTIKNKITPDMWEYYQDLLKVNGFNGINDLLSKFQQEKKENARLQGIIDEANGQEPVGYTGSGSVDAVKVGVEGHLFGTKSASHPIALYAHPIPAQQSPAVAVPDDEKPKVYIDCTANLGGDGSLGNPFNNFYEANERRRVTDSIKVAESHEVLEEFRND